MNISQLFGRESNIRQTESTSPVQAGKQAELNAQLKNLAPGQTIRGEIVAREGNEVRIRVAEDMEISARLDSGIQLEEGQNVTFEVRNNGSVLSLSPLYTNMANEANIMKAIEMASLPINEDTVEMTKQMMQAGLPVNRNALQQVYREINAFPQNEVSDVINLHRMQMPVTPENMQQMEAYRNLNHKIADGMTEIFDSIATVGNDLASQGKTGEVLEFYKNIVDLLAENIEGTASGETITGEAAGSATGSVTTSEVTSQAGAEVNTEVSAEISSEISSEISADGSTTVNTDALNNQAHADMVLLSANSDDAENMAIKLSTQMTEQLYAIVDEMELAPEALTDLQGRILNLAENGTKNDLQNLFIDLLSKAGSQTLSEQAGKNVAESLNRLFGEKEWKDLFTGLLRKQWTLKPEEVSRPDRVEEVYRKLNQQLKLLAGNLEHVGQQGSQMYKSVSNMQQNLDFMNQVNQMYQYVQLPLRLQNSETTGELYVYTNKRNLAAQNDKITALLHLDMQYLGPLDVYVTLKQSKVETNFRVADDKVLSFLEMHMDKLTDRLQKKGYDCTAKVMTKETEEVNSGLTPLVDSGRGELISQYSFDVRT